MTTLITGATAGIGRETAFKMATFGSNLILPVRNLSKGEELKTEILAQNPSVTVELFECDFNSLVSTKNFVDLLTSQNQKFQILINNVGVWKKEKKLSVDGIEQTFAVNHLAQFLLTHLILKNNLLENKDGKARIVNLSSMGHYLASPDWNDLEFTSRKFSSQMSYYNSKLYNVLFTQKLAKILAENKENNPYYSNITCNCLHPGIVNTQLLIMPKIVRQMLGWLIMTPEKGAVTSFFVATDKSLENTTGLYFDNCKIKKPSGLASLENQDKLWEISQKILEKFL
jgi:retinol dehydrogenase-12